eukprot:scaffold69618_cov17-Prasinocladus_malaysianus.AAC.1
MYNISEHRTVIIGRLRSYIFASRPQGLRTIDGGSILRTLYLSSYDSAASIAGPGWLEDEIDDAPYAE